MRQHDDPCQMCCARRRVHLQMLPLPGLDSRLARVVCAQNPHIPNTTPSAPALNACRSMTANAPSSEDGQMGWMTGAGRGGLRHGQASWTGVCLPSKGPAAPGPHDSGAGDWASGTRWGHFWIWASATCTRNCSWLAGHRRHRGRPSQFRPSTPSCFSLVCRKTRCGWSVI